MLLSTNTFTSDGAVCVAGHGAIDMSDTIITQFTSGEERQRHGFVGEQRIIVKLERNYTLERVIIDDWRTPFYVILKVMIDKHTCWNGTVAAVNFKEEAPSLIKPKTGKVVTIFYRNLYDEDYGDLTGSLVLTPVMAAETIEKQKALLNKRYGKFGESDHDPAFCPEIPELDNETVKAATEDVWSDVKEVPPEDIAKAMASENEPEE